MADNFTFKDSTGATQTCRSTDNSGIHTTHTIIAKTNGTGINVGQTTMVESFPVVLASNQTSIPVTDNGGSLTVDGSVTVSGSAAVTIVDGGDVTLGAKADSAASTDTGTFTLMSLIKRLLSVTIGSITETAPATDTASSGLNGRLQRIAQNITSFIGSLTETAPATDTASSAINGRLQRIAQRLTTSIGYLSSIDTYTQSNGNILSTIDTSLSSIDALNSSIDNHTLNIETSNSGILTVTGTTADAATTTDTTGTIKSAMRGLVKWAYERMPVALGQGTMAQGLRVVLPSDQTAIPVTDNGGILTVDGTVTDLTVVTSTKSTSTVGSTATTYTTGDVIGSKLTFTSLTGTKTGAIKGVVLNTATGTPFDAKIILFEADPSSSTISNDAALVIPTVDLEKIVGIVSIASSNFVMFSSSASAYVECHALVEGVTVYGVIMAGTTAPTFLAGNQVSITLSAEGY